MFTKWPSRFVRIGNTAEQAVYFRDEFARLKKRKYFLLTRLWDTDITWTVDMRLARKFWSLTSLARDFFELNFHRTGTLGYPAKTRNPEEVIKELRLNFNAHLIKEISPSAKVVVVLRNYAANVKSIAQHISQGSLPELARLLEDRYGDWEIHHIFDYWASSYNSLLADLDESNIEYFVIRQDELMRNGRKTIDALFHFIGLEPEPSVYDYFASSDTQGRGKHSTDRDHAAILSKNKQAERELYPALEEEINQIHWHPLIKESVTKPDQEC